MGNAVNPIRQSATRLVLPRPGPRTSPSAGGVTAAELFFDLVFVFVVTQATHEVEAHPNVIGLVHALLPLLAVWWMFLAFGWLTNAVRPDSTPVRLLLVLAMVAFFITGLDLPFAFEPDGWAFGVGYAAVVLIHTLLFLTASSPKARRGIWRVAPFNAGACGLVLLAPHLPGAGPEITWALAVALLYGVPLLRSERGFVLQPHHFVERHGLILLLVLGESIVAIGIGAAGDPVDLALAAGVALGIALAAALWWIYFDGDEERSMKALAEAPEEQRSTMAIRAFAFGHVIMVTGIIVLAAGITDAVHHLTRPTSHWLLGAGSATFLLGHAVHRASLRTGRLADRLVGAVAALLLAFTAADAGWAALTVTTAVLAAVAAIDHWRDKTSQGVSRSPAASTL